MGAVGIAGIWTAAVLLGSIGMYGAACGGGLGAALAGAGTMICALFLALLGLRHRRGEPRVLPAPMALLGYAGLVVAVCGFLLERGWY
jgi:hypothetical protein